MAIDGLALVAARNRLRLETADSLRAYGIELLSAGHETALPLAIAEDLSLEEAGRLFERVCRQLAQPTPELDEALDEVTSGILRDILASRTEIQAGLEQLMREIVRPYVWGPDPRKPAGRPTGLDDLVGAHYTYDELRDRPEENSIDGVYGEAAVALLDQRALEFARGWLASRDFAG